MQQQAVTVRLPKNVHTQAKLAAVRAGMSLQSWFGAVAVKGVASGGGQVDPEVPFARAYHELPPNQRRLVRDVVELLTLCSREHVRNLELHITGLVKILRRVDPKFLREFERL